MSGRRRANLRAALGFLRLPPTEPELRLLHRWLGTWSGVGLITVALSPLTWEDKRREHEAAAALTELRQELNADYAAGGGLAHSLATAYGWPCA